MSRYFRLKRFLHKNTKICPCCRPRKWLSVQKLTLATKMGCPDCSLVLDALITFFDGQMVHPSCRFIYSFQRKSLNIIFEKEIGGTRAIAVVFSPYRPGDVDSEPANRLWEISETRPLRGNTSSDLTMRHVTELMRDCQENHEPCRRLSTSPMPKRILEISTKSVYLREATRNSAKYACLSHCWGIGGPTVILTKATMSSLSQGYAVCELPKTFRDAVVVCRSLGIPYLWIDALCESDNINTSSGKGSDQQSGIIQDSPEDWAEAANTMADIYENACITMAAVSAANSQEGLFSSDRSAKRLSKHPQFYVRPPNATFPATDIFKHLNQNVWPLLSRAWVYQERRLSPRIVYFGKDQIYWECRYMFTSEDGYDNILWTHDFTSDWPDWSRDPNRSWGDIIHEYSGLQLTYERDRLPAIAAVANRMSLLREGDVYIAGMWKNSIVSDLYWRRAHDNPKPRPERMVPSWSWASIGGSQVWFYPVRESCGVELMSLSYNIVGPPYLGTVENCRLVLRGPILSLTGTKGLSHQDVIDIHQRPPAGTDFMLKKLRLVFQSRGFDIKYERFCPDYELETSTPPFDDGADLKMILFDSSPDLGALVLRQLSKGSDEYERIGVFDTMFTNKNGGSTDVGEFLRLVPVEEVVIV